MSSSNDVPLSVPPLNNSPCVSTLSNEMHTLLSGGDASFLKLIGRRPSATVANESFGIEENESKDFAAAESSSSRPSLVEDRRRCHQEALLHVQLTRERLGKMEAVLKSVEPTFERIPLYIEKLRLIKKSMHAIEENVKLMRRDADEIYNSSGLEK